MTKMEEKKQLGPGFDWISSDEVFAHADKFIDKVSIPHIKTCWTWEGRIEKSGHAVFHMNGRIIPVHKFAWLLWRGEVPEKLFARPVICENKYCVSMYHMKLVGRGWARRSKTLIRERDVIVSKWLYGKRSIRSLSDEYKVSWDTMNKFIANNHR